MTELYIRVRTRPVNITCVQVYAPTTNAEAVDIEDFYSDLQAALNETPKKDVLIIMGDEHKNRKGERIRNCRKTWTWKQK